jgi:hypothetical protein
MPLCEAAAPPAAWLHGQKAPDPALLTPCCLHCNPSAGAAEFHAASARLSSSRWLLLVLVVLLLLLLMVLRYAAVPAAWELWKNNS